MNFTLENIFTERQLEVFPNPPAFLISITAGLKLGYKFSNRENIPIKTLNVYKVFGIFKKSENGEGRKAGSLVEGVCASFSEQNKLYTKTELDFGLDVFF
jgi:hypothetical protein